MHHLGNDPASWHSDAGPCAAGTKKPPAAIARWLGSWLWIAVVGLLVCSDLATPHGHRACDVISTTTHQAVKSSGGMQLH